MTEDPKRGTGGVSHIEPPMLSGEQLEDQLERVTKERDDLRVQLSDRTRELEVVAATAEKSATARSLFFANMSHEIRTPITGIFGTVQLLQATRLSRQQRELVGNLEDSARNLFTLIENILDLSKMDAGAVELSCEPFILADTVNDLLKLHDQRLKAKGLAVSVSLDPSLPTIVYGDPVRLKQVLSTLLSNALRLGGSELIELSASSDDHAGNGVLVHFRIRDASAAVQPEVWRDLFSSFAEMQSSTARHLGGAALGFAVCTKLAELMGGNVWGSSTAEAGTEVHFTARLDLPEEETERGETMVTTFSGDDQESPLRVLVAEDDRISRRLIEQAVQKSGFTVTVVTNGREAIEALSREHFDAVLMDVSMPELDGMSATKQLRSFPETNPNRTIPVIALTAHAYLEDRQRCLSAGMTDVLVKPFLFDTLRNVLLQHVTRQ